MRFAMLSLTCPAMKEFLHKLHSNKIFEWTVVSVIILSALLIGAKTYELPEYATTALMIADWSITAFFFN